MKKSDFGVVGIIYAVALAFLVMTLDLPEGAQTYPLVLISALIGVNTLYLIRALTQWRQNHHIEDDIGHTFKDFLPLQFFGVIAWCVGYLVLMYVCGYYLSTVLYLVGSMLFLRVNPLQIGLTVVAMGAMVAVVFSWFLHVPLPTGLFF